MSCTFKQFIAAASLSDDEFYELEEGLSDLPGFGWLKGPDNKAKLDKIKAERAKLLNRRDKLSAQKADELDAWLSKNTKEMPKLKTQVADPRDPYERDAEAQKMDARMGRMGKMGSIAR